MNKRYTGEDFAASKSGRCSPVNVALLICTESGPT
jgi:hypothetical protein